MGSVFAQSIDAELVDRARRGDSASHETLYRRFAGPVYTLARRMLIRPELAEEVLQDTFLTMIRRIGDFRADAPVGIWIRTIAVNQCLMIIRSPWHQRARPLDYDPGSLPDPAYQIQDHLDLIGALARLSDTARAVVWLHDVEGYTHREIGGLMGKTPSFSKSRLARAHAQLRDVLTETNGDSLCMPVLNNC